MKKLTLLCIVALISISTLRSMEPETLDLPRDVQQIIANKTLRAILDDAENDSALLMQPQRRSPKNFSEMINSLSYYQEKAPLIDMALLLIQNGANPNTKNYKGNTVLHLLMKAIGKNLEQPNADSFSYLSNIEAKIKDLSRYAINFNAQNNEGRTIALMLSSYATTKNCEIIHSFLDFLISFGLDVTIKSDFENVCNLEPLWHLHSVERAAQVEELEKAIEELERGAQNMKELTIRK